MNDTFSIKLKGTDWTSWVFVKDQSSHLALKLQENDGRKNTLVTQSCVISDA